MTNPVGISIVGGGLAGCTLALRLADRGWPVTLYEAESWQVPTAKVSRTLALTESSWASLHACGISPDTLPTAAIETIHVSQQGFLGQVMLRAHEDKSARYGATVAYDRILGALRDRVDEHPQILVKAQHRVESVKSSRIAAQMTFRTADDRIDTVFSSLVVIAEGGKALEDTSAIRWSYQTSALSCLVESDDPVTTVAYERFTRKGPMALLPAAAGWAVIWTGPNPDIHRLIELNDQDFLTELQAAFGDRVGRLTATTPRVLYPLRAGFSLTTVEPRIVRIGNAAQTLHPVAGQGFNLGLRDVDTLVSLLDPLSLHDPGLTATLERYARLRTRDRGVTGLLTHVLAGGFTLPLPALRSAASLLFLLLDLSPQWKQKFSHLMADGVRP